MTPTTMLRGMLTAVVFVVAVALTGCAPQQSGYGADTAELLQGEVLEISELSAGSDFAAALLALSELEVSLKDARARGLLTEERFESITAALALVKADLEAAIAAQAPPPAPEPEPEEGGDGGDDEGEGNSGKGNGDKGKGNDNGDDD
ncbi:hypothetical protein ACX3O0_07915 [Homoserinimonas sp. A447]